MNGSAAAARNEREAILQAMKTPPVDGYFAWDGLNEDERPASAEEMQVGVALALKKRGRPSGSGVKEQVAIRFDRDVVQAFRATGKGWQTSMNDALKDWLRTHTPLT